MGKKLGDPRDPLLVSVRSGAALSMPGMMDTVLNLGLNDQAVQGLAKVSGSERFAWDAYRRFITMFGGVVKGVPHHDFEHEMDAVKKAKKVTEDVDLDAADLKKLVDLFKKVYKKATKQDFPQDPMAAALGGHRRRVRLLEQPAGHQVPRHPRDQGAAGHRRQRAGHGVRQPRRHLRHGGLLHPRPLHRREDLLRRVPDERPGRGRRGRHPHPSDPGHPEEEEPEDLRAARRRAHPAGERITRTCRTWSSPSSRARSSSCRPATASAPAWPPCAWPWRWSRRG